MSPYKRNLLLLTLGASVSTVIVDALLPLVFPTNSSYAKALFTLCARMIGLLFVYRAWALMVRNGASKLCRFCMLAFGPIAVLLLPDQHHCSNCVRKQDPPEAKIRIADPGGPVQAMALDLDA